MSDLTATASEGAKANIGVIGLGVMGASLARNLAHHDNTVAVYNRHSSKTVDFMKNHGAEGAFIPSGTMEEFVASLAKPRKVILMITAGPATDAVIDELLGIMEPEDIIIDGGNSFYEDTIRREKNVSAHGLHFVGCGISGGEEGALKGPSMMPGGSDWSWEYLKPIFESIAARAEGEPCVTHIGENGAGHFVKMVHNGIEYADMQLIGESYDLMRRGLGMSPAEIGDVFDDWDKGELDSYLVEITSEVLHHTDAKTGKPFVDVVVDQAGMKGTGTWTVQTALSLAVPVTGIAEAVFARGLSGQTEQRRENLANPLAGPDGRIDLSAAGMDKAAFVEAIRQALYASKIVAYAQGFDEIQAGAEEHNWHIDLGAVARIWRGGCIIRAKFLNRISDAYDSGRKFSSLLFADYFKSAVEAAQAAWRKVVAAAAQAGIPVPAFASSLSYYDGLRSGRLPAALVQGQRDFFGAHTYKRVDMPGTFHTLWAEEGRQEVSSN